MSHLQRDVVFANRLWSFDHQVDNDILSCNDKFIDSFADAIYNNSHKERDEKQYGGVRFDVSAGIYSALSNNQIDETSGLFPMDYADASEMEFE